MQADFYATATGVTASSALIGSRIYDLMQLRAGSIPHVSLSSGGNGDDGDDGEDAKIVRGWLQ